MEPIKIPAICQFRLCKLTDRELILKISTALDEMYKDGELPKRHIPARPNDDFDLLLGELIIRFSETKNIKQ